jgi:prolipoprotein diacylglyceryltransferase
MLQQKTIGPEADAVFDSMKAVKFNFKGATCTWYGFWFGSGLTVSIFLLLSAFIAWQLENVPLEQWHLTSAISWGLVAAHLANTILAWAYFFTGAGVLSTGVTMLLAAGAWRKESQRALARSQKKL